MTTRLLFALCSLVYALAPAQSPSVLLFGRASSSDGLPPGIAQRWRASSLSSSPVTTWTDEIQGANLTQTTANKKPLWSSTGGGQVEFWGTNTLDATNFLTSGSPYTNAFLVVLKFNDTTAPQLVMGQADSGGQRFVGIEGSGAGYLYENSTVTAIKIDANRVFDLVLVRTNSPTGSRAFTNGVSAFLNANGFNADAGVSFIGSAAASAFFRGTIQEIIVWTNVMWSMTEVAAVHRYSTNIYGHTP